MKSFIDSLNLRPNERRLLVGVALVTFIVINFYFIFPHFDDWGQLQSAHRKAQNTLELYQEQIGRLPGFTNKLAEIESANPIVLPLQQAFKLSETIQSSARRFGIRHDTLKSIPSASSSLTKTNQFFEEKRASMKISQTRDGPLVQFLLALGEDESMIRVERLALTRDRSNLNLTADIVFVANYQKSSHVQP